MTGSLPAGLLTTIGSVPGLDPQTAVAQVLRDFPDCPSWPQLPQWDPGEGMAAQILALVPGVQPEGVLWRAPWGPGQPPPPVKLPIPALPASHAAGYPAFLDALKAHPRPLAKAQLAGPATLAWHLQLADGTPALGDPGTVAWLGELCGRIGAQMVREYKVRGVRTVICALDEPAWVAATTVAGDRLNGAIRDAVAAIQATGALAMLHCCAGADFAQFAGLGLDILSFDAVHYAGEFLEAAPALGPELEAGLVIGWGVVDTRSPVQPAEVLALVERWKDLAGRVVAGRTWEEIFRQSLFTPACGLGTLTPGEAEQVVMDLRAFGAAVRQVQMC